MNKLKKSDVIVDIIFVMVIIGCSIAIITKAVMVNIKNNETMQQIQQTQEETIEDTFIEMKEEIISIRPSNKSRSIEISVSTDEEYSHTETEEITEETTATNEILMELPDINTEFKAYTDYEVYGLTYTPHYRLQQIAYTDENGLRRVNDDYIIGLAPYYTKQIGDRFRVTLENGNTFTVCVGDSKADCDETQMYTPTGENGCVLEFIVDTDRLTDKTRLSGTISTYEEFRGNVTEIVYIGRLDGDWDSYQ